MRKTKVNILTEYHITTSYIKMQLAATEGFTVSVKPVSGSDVGLLFVLLI